MSLNGQRSYSDPYESILSADLIKYDINLNHSIKTDPHCSCIHLIYLMWLQAQVADIGLMGCPAKKDGKAVEGVRIFLGGSIGENAALASEFEKVDCLTCLPRSLYMQACALCGMHACMHACIHTHTGCGGECGGEGGSRPLQIMLSAPGYSATTAVAELSLSDFTARCLKAGTLLADDRAVACRVCHAMRRSCYPF